MVVVVVGAVVVAVVGVVVVAGVVIVFNPHVHVRKGKKSFSQTHKVFRGQFYKTFYGRKLLLFIMSQSVSPWQAFPA